MFITELTNDLPIFDHLVEFIAGAFGTDTMTVILGLVVLSSLAILKALDIVL